MKSLLLLRRRELVDKKHVAGLAPEEAAELAGLDAAVDEEFAPFYRRILSRIREAASR